MVYTAVPWYLKRIGFRTPPMDTKLCKYSRFLVSPPFLQVPHPQRQKADYIILIVTRIIIPISVKETGIEWLSRLPKITQVASYKEKKWKVKVLVTQLCSTLSLHGLWSTRLLCPWNSLGKNTGVGSLSLLQGIFPTKGSNPALLHCRLILYCLSHQASK